MVLIAIFECPRIWKEHLEVVEMCAGTCYTIVLCVAKGKPKRIASSKVDLIDRIEYGL